MNFIRQAIKKPKYTGAIAPSSPRLSRLITHEADLSDARMVVEIGPGTGVFTRLILQNISPDTAYFAMEINADFVENLQQRFPGLDVYHGDAKDIRHCLEKYGCQHCDRIISGIPWTAFDDKLQNEILNNIYEALSPAGIFVTFAYFPLNHLFNGTLFKIKLRQLFSEVRQTRIVANIPPAFVYVCRK